VVKSFEAAPSRARLTTRSTWVSTALMKAVEPQQPGYLSHSDAAATPLDRLTQRQTLLVGQRPQR
jgi:hypothetical protein